MAAAKTRKSIGKEGEDIACQFLERKGFTVIGRNYSKKWGEIDIIATKGNVVRFVEVKTVSRENPDYMPEELVHQSKLEKVARTASLYMEETKDSREYQVDAVTVVMNERTRTARCHLFEQVL